MSPETKGEPDGPSLVVAVTASFIGSVCGAVIAELFVGGIAQWGWWLIPFQPVVMFLLLGAFKLGQRSRG